MTVFDTRIPLHETQDDVTSMHRLIHTLDDMLNHYGLEHSFTYASLSEQEGDSDLLYWLLYDSKQDTVVTLVVALFIKFHLEKDDAEVRNSVIKSMMRKL